MHSARFWCVALIPGDDVESPLTFFLTIAASLAINMDAGIGFYLYARRKRS